MKISDLSVEEFKALVRASVEEALDDYLAGEADLELAPELVDRLAQSMAADQPTVSTQQLIASL